MCFVWRHRLIVSIILVLVIWDVNATDAQPFGKVYPRGNHWAVGHLMGKKSTDEYYSDGGERNYKMSPDQDSPLERYSKDSLQTLLYVIMRRWMEAQNMSVRTDKSETNLLQRVLKKRNQWWENHLGDEQIHLIEDLIQALRMQGDYES